ncbi:NAD(P)-dependent oxidoreductase [Actinomadura sp. BRA 177]|uniref:NAD(P)-dependent oxidoreductase n=1 Tax=Actinomadura sp. BRA 177 TaxID=2745202 RepID=UPI0015950084|nr:NAD(P)H-binding protein [Actinomadura sp. BRA 177]NVI91835.1 NAD(P)H-binding protein [Actinomadura sp. BRA 177]
MRLTIFGATGGTGVRTVRRALDAGHDVTAVVRDPAGLPSDLRACADVVRADVMDPAAIEEAVKGRDAVLSALGTREGRAPTSVCADGTRSITTAMTAAGADRFILVSASGLHAGPGDDPFTRFVVKPLILQPLLKHAFTDMRAAEALTRASGLRWTIVRPPRLTNGPGNGRYRKAADRNVLGGMSMARNDLATALLDLAGDSSSIHQVISVAG